MSWRRASLLTNSTRVPAGTVSSFGLTTPRRQRERVGIGRFGVVGVDVLPPHDAASTLRTIAARVTPPDYRGRRSWWQTPTARPRFDRATE